MKDRLHATHTVSYANPVRYRADVGRERRLQDIEADHVVLQVRQRAEQGLAEMTGTSRNQNLHDRATSDNQIVIRGLDPRIHPTSGEQSCEEDGLPGQARQ
jgi:hypothetical protein